MQYTLEKNAGLREVGAGIKEVLLKDIPGTPPGVIEHLNTIRANAGDMPRNAAPPKARVPAYGSRSVGIRKVGFAKQAGHMAALQQYGLLT